MKLKGHIIATFTISAFLYYICNSFSIFISSLIGGIFIDVDHLLDYYLYNGMDLRISNFFNWCYKKQWDTLIVFFHSIELLFAFWIVIMVFNLGTFWIGLAIGVSQHLVLDMIVNGRQINVFSYFFIFRFINGFRKEYIMRENYQ